MSTNPTTPNLPDYVAFLTGVVGIPNAFLPTLLGTATDGSTAFLIDASEDWNPDQWAGFMVTDMTQGLTAVVDSNSAQSLTFVDELARPVVGGDMYLISPDVVPTSFAIAMEIVNGTIAQASARMYVLAVYNLAADRLINYALDVEHQTYFTDLRKMLRLNDPIIGVPAAANDGGTSVAILNPEQMKTFTLQDLETLRTPYGRQYIGIAQKYGPSIWGIS